MLKNYLIIFLVFGLILDAKQLSAPKKKHTLAICSVIKNEAKYLKEWIEFHRLVGVEHFYIYNNNSTDRLYNILSPYIKKRLVTLIPWPDFLGSIEDDKSYQWALSTQIPAYENAILFKAGPQTKWLALLTPDEYLVPVESYTMIELLEKYDSAPGILLYTDVFDASKTNLFPSPLIIESIDLTQPPKQNIQKTIAKLIVKTDQCKGFTWPPYRVVFKNDQQPIQLKKSEARINRYINRDRPIIETLKHKMYLDPRQVSPGEISSLLDKGYFIEDQERTIYRYIPLMKSNLP